MLAINHAEYVGDYRIRLSFNDGREGIANLEKTLFHDKRPIFSNLKEKSNFRAFKLDHGTIVWPNELDLAPEYLFYLVFKEDDRYREQFRQWGYE
uniref:DUF2442 domain-containing protein n=1 Tax=Candidatus Kentrum sp. UNK TaxID=2126344 RepID=A0A451B051_9GAMM|nr:MAG: Protein of unknown function (DUF2442) [Candidatus Kentron sp. UNK]VFK71653.1 MAG: Protein of unknown function (DUF2442) [Candidatus Kentron sp. UNK]